MINKWQNEPLLYNVNSPNYHDKTKRLLAVERIWDGMSLMEYNPMPTKEQILDKMGGLRTYFNVQRNKVESSKQTGSSTDTVYKPKWQFYECLQFLMDMVTLRRTTSNLDPIIFVHDYIKYDRVTAVHSFNDQNKYYL